MAGVSCTELTALVSAVVSVRTGLEHSERQSRTHRCEELQAWPEGVARQKRLFEHHHDAAGFREVFARVLVEARPERYGLAPETRRSRARPT